MSATVAVRPSGRAPDQLRAVAFETGLLRHAEGSCLVSFGGTRVLCAATVESRVPPFLRNTGRGWVTAEYAMLPRSTGTRSPREVTRGRPGGRTHEIQRLIGRSLRAVTDLELLGERQIILDCDVLEADGGTRTAAISGAYLALQAAVAGLLAKGELSRTPLRCGLAAVSAGLYQGVPVLDLDYAEDSVAEADGNFVMTADGGIVELQITAEQRPLNAEEAAAIQLLARKGIEQITALQEAATAARTPGGAEAEAGALAAALRRP